MRIFQVFFLALFDKNVNVRSVAALTLNKLGQVSPELLRDVARVLNESQSVDNREYAAEFFSNLGVASPFALKVLSQGLKDKNGRVRNACLSALKTFGAVAWTDEVVMAWLESMVMDLQMQIKNEGEFIIDVVSFSNVMISKLSTTAVPTHILRFFIEGLKGSHGETPRSFRQECALILSMFSAAATPKEVIPALLALAQEQDDELDDRSYVAVFGRLIKGKPEAEIAELLEFLQKGLQHVNKGMREACATALSDAAVANPSVLQALSEGLTSDKELSVRTACAEALGNIGVAAATPVVLAALTQAMTLGLDLGEYETDALSQDIAVDIDAISHEKFNNLINTRGLRQECLKTLRKFGAVAATDQILAVMLKNIHIVLTGIFKHSTSAISHFAGNMWVEMEPKSYLETLAVFGPAAATKEVLAAMLFGIQSKAEGYYLNLYPRDWLETLDKLGAEAATPEIVQVLLAGLSKGRDIIYAEKLGNLQQVTPQIITALIDCLQTSSNFLLQTACVDALSKLAKVAALAELGKIEAAIEKFAKTAKDFDLQLYCTEMLSRFRDGVASPRESKQAAIATSASAISYSASSASPQPVARSIAPDSEQEARRAQQQALEEHEVSKLSRQIERGDVADLLAVMKATNTPPGAAIKDYVQSQALWTVLDSKASTVQKEQQVAVLLETPGISLLEKNDQGQLLSDIALEQAARKALPMAAAMKIVTATQAQRESESAAVLQFAEEFAAARIGDAKAAGSSATPSIPPKEIVDFIQAHRKKNQELQKRLDKPMSTKDQQQQQLLFRQLIHQAVSEKFILAVTISQNWAKEAEKFRTTSTRAVAVGLAGFVANLFIPIAGGAAVTFLDKASERGYRKYRARLNLKHALGISKLKDLALITEYIEQSMLRRYQDFLLQQHTALSPQAMKTLVDTLVERMFTYVENLDCMAGLWETMKQQYAFKHSIGDEQAIRAFLGSKLVNLYEKVNNPPRATIELTDKVAEKIAENLVMGTSLLKDGIAVSGPTICCTAADGSYQYLKVNAICSSSAVTLASSEIGLVRCLKATATWDAGAGSYGVMYVTPEEAELRKFQRGAPWLGHLPLLGLDPLSPREQALLRQIAERDEALAQRDADLAEERAKRMALEADISRSQHTAAGDSSLSESTPLRTGLLSSAALFHSSSSSTAVLTPGEGSSSSPSLS